MGPQGESVTADNEAAEEDMENQDDTAEKKKGDGSAPTEEAQDESVSRQSFGTPAMIGIAGGVLSLLCGGFYWALKTRRLCRKSAEASSDEILVPMPDSVE